MSQKKNNGREFEIDLSDDSDYLDFGTDDDDFDNMEQVHELTLAELFDRDELRRQDREQCEREERQARRTQTQENTVSNSGDFPYFMLFVFVYVLIIFCPQLLPLPSFPAQSASV